MSDQAPVGSGSAASSPADAQCLACGYSLAGVPAGSPCPECGAPQTVTEEFMLRNSDPLYQRTLLKGVSFVLNGIIGMIIFMIIGIAASMAVASNQPATTATPSIGPLEVGLQLIGLVFSLVIAYGWWLFSESDTKLAGQNDGGTPRQLVRVCVAISVIATVLNFAIYLLAWVTGSDLLAGILMLVIGVVSGIAGIVAFFAQMLYVKWLAPRLPNAAVYKRSKTLLWLGPVLYTFGLLLLGLGPLIALVLYWNMLDKVRKDLKGIVASSGTPGGGFQQVN